MKTHANLSIEIKKSADGRRAQGRVEGESMGESVDGRRGQGRVGRKSVVDQRDQ